MPLRRTFTADSDPTWYTEYAADINWQEFVQNARVAVEAMREPTEAMLKAPIGGDRHNPPRLESRTDLRPHIYRAMIDTVLEEENVALGCGGLK